MYKVISTFSGIGGSSTGYEMAGLNVVAAVEFLDYQAKNYRLNHPTTKLYQQDIRTLDPVKILEELNLKPGELDILDGSPPCSSFSTCGSVKDGWGKVKPYGNTKQRTDDLFFEYIRFIKAMQPKVFIAENVSGLIKGDSKGMFNIFFRAMKECGYNVRAKLINAANYGVPQIRERVIFIGFRNDLNLIPSFPVPDKRTVTLGEAFKDVVNSEADLKEVDITRFSIYKRLKALPLYGHDKKRFSLLKESPFKPCRTIIAQNGNLGAASICHWDNRKFTINELKAISGFPQSYKIAGKNYQEKAEGISRAVPPPMMKSIAQHIKQQLINYVSQSNT